MQNVSNQDPSALCRYSVANIARDHEGQNPHLEGSRNDRSNLTKQ
jgi:hypothetical protein